MAAIKCPSCGRNYSSTMKECPYCKTPNNTSSNNSNNTSQQSVPIHKRPDSNTPKNEQKQNVKPQSVSSGTQKPKADPVVNIPQEPSTPLNDVNAEMQEKLRKMEEEKRKMEEENRKLRDELNNKSKEEKNAKPDPDVSSSKDVAPAEDDASTIDESFDKIMHPEKYPKETAKKSNSLLNKVSSMIPEKKDDILKKTSLYSEEPDETEEFDEPEEFDENIEVAPLEITERKTKRKILSNTASSDQRSHNNDKISSEELETESDDTIEEQEDFDPNYDHYYDDVLPELLAEKDRIPKETVIRSVIMIAACVIAVLVAAYRLV